MDQVKLEGHTLGKKHEDYNKKIKETIAIQTKDVVKDIDFKENDLNNLVKIDLASAARNVNYILDILKGNDMLYVSRAITRCPWLITDNNYAHIIHPEYLHSNLIPLMMAKAANKLMLHIRLNLQEEPRVENFFNYYENLNLETALKWLPHCSAAFMETKVKKYTDKISPHLLKRMCEKSHRILEVYVNRSKGRAKKHLQATLFLLNTNTEFYLDLAIIDRYNTPKFNAKMTKMLMKRCPERIHQSFSKYAGHIHLPTFVKYLNPNNVKDFLLTQVTIEKFDYYSWLNFQNVQHFIKRMPQEERYKFIKDMFVNKGFENDESDSEQCSRSSSECTESKDISEVDSKVDENTRMRLLYKFMRHPEPQFWYVFLPFDEVLTEVKKNIEYCKKVNTKYEVLKCLIKIVAHDFKHLETILQYYNDSHLKEDDNCNRMRFVNNLLKHTNVLNYDSQCWQLLNNIFSAMNLYTEKEDYSCYDKKEQVCIKAIIIHEILNEREVSEIVIKKFHFHTFKEYQKKISSEEQTIVFNFLYNHLLKKIDDKNIEDHTIIDKNSQIIRFMLSLLTDWQKNLSDYPYVLNKIKDLIKVKQNNSLKVSLSWIYDVNKKWRKYMFEESIVLCASERVCINALKHDPSLLSRNDNIVSTIRGNDTIPLRQFLIKIKVYWPGSLASEWIQAYRVMLKEPLRHRVSIRGLCFLLPRHELRDIINVHKPEESKINWEENDENLISLRRHIAMNMHLGRPQPTPDEILQYAKGDYLQFALPSLNAISYNLCNTRTQELIPRLMNSPVSLQKHGVRLAFAKMQSEELQRIFRDYWKTIKNLSIRAVVFKMTYDLLCKENDPAKNVITWNLLEIYIDGLTFEEDKTIYERLADVRKVPLNVRPFYVVKSYKFLKSLFARSDLDKSKYERALESLIYVINDLIESIEPQFVDNILQEYFAAIYKNDKTDGFVHGDLTELMVSYLTCTESEEIQAERYNSVLLPLLRHTFAVWAEKDKNDIVKTNLKKLLQRLRKKLVYIFNKNKVVPVAMFADIQKELEQLLHENDAYFMRTEWKLIVAFTKLMKDSKASVERSNYTDDKQYWDALCMCAALQFGKTCLEFLKEDIKSFFPSIDEYFSMALRTVCEDLRSDILIEVLKHMLTDDLIQSYLVTIRLLPQHYRNCQGENMLLQLHQTILSQPSLEVKMHFYHKNPSYKYKN